MAAPRKTKRERLLEVTPTQRFFSITSQVLGTPVIDEKDIEYYLVRGLPKRSYYKLILSIGQPAITQSIIGPLIDYDGTDERLNAAGTALVLRTAKVFSLAEMLTGDRAEVGQWMLAPVSFGPGQPNKSPISLCVSSAVGAQVIERRIRSELENQCLAP